MDKLSKLSDALDKVNADNPHLKPLDPLEAIPVTHGMKMVKVDPDAKYIVFMSFEDFERIGEHFMTDPLNPLPAGTPIYVVEDTEKSARIYEILDTKISNGH